MVKSVTAANVDRDRLRKGISDKYTEVALEPEKGFHFHTGRPLAAMLGYSTQDYDQLPAWTIDSFAGTGNPFSMGKLHEGEVVLDLGSGAGFDLLQAARNVGPSGRAIGIDMTEPMAERARASARALGFGQVEVRVGDALDLPVDSESVDFVISNGVLNLTPDKEQAFGEVFRILKPGGQFLYGDIVVASELSESIRRDVDLWTG